MKQWKYLLALVLALCMLFALCACGGDTDVSEPESSAPVAESSEATAESSEADDGKVTYQVTVVDANNAPIAGALVQMCKETCYPGSTGADGTVEFALAEDTYKVSFLTLPAGYAYSTDETEFYFADGSTELTITLKAAE